jgi:hypothetical protein
VAKKLRRQVISSSSLTVKIQNNIVDSILPSTSKSFAAVGVGTGAITTSRTFHFILNTGNYLISNSATQKKHQSQIDFLAEIYKSCQLPEPIYLLSGDHNIPI